MKKEKKEMEMPQMDVAQAMHHLEKAEEIKADSKLMAQIKKHHAKMGKLVKANMPVKSLAELKKAAKDEMEKDNSEGDE
jgi:hypothetical protein